MKLFNEIIAELVKNEMPEADDKILKAASDLKAEATDGHLVNDITALASKLKRNGFEKLAEEISEKLFLYKTAQSGLYGVTADTIGDLLNVAHGDGDVQILPAQEWYGHFQTDTSAQQKTLEMVKRQPKQVGNGFEHYEASETDGALSESDEGLSEMIEDLEEGVEQDELRAVASMLLKEAQEDKAVGVNKRIEYVKDNIKSLLDTANGLIGKAKAENPFTEESILKNKDVRELYSNSTGVNLAQLNSYIKYYNLAYGDGPYNVDKIMHTLKGNKNLLKVFYEAKLMNDLRSPDGSYDTSTPTPVGVFFGAAGIAAAIADGGFDKNPELIVKAANEIESNLKTIHDNLLSDGNIAKANEKIKSNVSGRLGTESVKDKGGHIDSLIEFLKKSYDQFSTLKLESMYDMGSVRTIWQANNSLYKNIQAYNEKSVKQARQLYQLYGENSSDFLTKIAYLIRASKGLSNYITETFEQKPPEKWDPQVTAFRFAKAEELWGKYLEQARLEAKSEGTIANAEENLFKSKKYKEALSKTSLAAIIDSLGVKLRTYYDVDGYSIYWLNTAREATQ